MAHATLRFVAHRITQHPDTDVTFEAECLHCEVPALQVEGGAVETVRRLMSSA